MKTIVKGSNTNSIHKQYEIGNQIGSGKFSIVKQGTNKTNGKQSAIKIMKKSMVEEQAIIKEVEMMAELTHQNIVSLEEIYETENEILLVLELVTGGELFDKIVEREFYTEQDASVLIGTVTKVIKYLHSKDIVHCDLKPENLLYSDTSDQAIIKLCDFGLSQRCGSGAPLSSLVGTLTYMAPEISSCTGYGKPVDLWSLGVIAYILLCGFPPFDETTGYVLEFPSPEWDNISDSAKSLIKGLLTNDPVKRFTIDSTLKHPWIAGTNVGKNSIVGTLKTLREFNTLRRTNGGTTTMGHNKQSRGTVFELFPSLTPIKQQPIEEQQSTCNINKNNIDNNVIIDVNNNININNINSGGNKNNNNSYDINDTSLNISELDSTNKTKLQLINSLDFELDSSSSETYSSSSPQEITNDKLTLSPEICDSLKIIDQLKNEKSLLQKELQEIKRSHSPTNNQLVGTGNTGGGSGTLERQFRPIHMSKQDNSDGSYENLLLGTSPLIRGSQFNNGHGHSRNSSFGNSFNSGGSGDESSSKKDKSKYGVDKIVGDLQLEIEKLNLPKDQFDKISNVLVNYKQKNQEKSLKLKLDKQKEKYKKLKALLKKDKILK